MYIFFFNDTATTEIYTLSLHDALPILPMGRSYVSAQRGTGENLRPETRRQNWAASWTLVTGHYAAIDPDRKSTRLNSSHANISYAVFCLKKKTEKKCDDHTDQLEEHDK